jgi:hypothetical protein
MIEATINLLGLKGRDRVTGYRGTVTTAAFDLYGCVQLHLSPDANGETGKLDAGHFFDVHRIEVEENNRVMPVPAFRELVTEPDKPSTYTHGANEKAVPRV